MSLKWSGCHPCKHWWLNSSMRIYLGAVVYLTGASYSRKRSWDSTFVETLDDDAEFEDEYEKWKSEKNCKLIEEIWKITVHLNKRNSTQNAMIWFAFTLKNSPYLFQNSSHSLVGAPAYRNHIIDDWGKSDWLTNCFQESVSWRFLWSITIIRI